MQKSTTLQVGLIAATSLLLVLMLLLGRTVPSQKKGEAAEKESTVTDEVLLTEARAKLDSAKLAWLAELDKQKAQATDLIQEAEVLKLISKTWNEWENFAAGALYAEKAAELAPSAEAWSIAGTTYGIAFQRSQDSEIKQFVARKAINAFEQAAIEEPDTLRHAVNEALMYVELSAVDATVMPMTGIQKLLELDRKHPDNVGINMTLGRLSMMRSGDLEKAVKRFEKVTTLADKAVKEDLIEAHFLLVECYKELGKREKVLYHYDQCIELTKEDEAMNKQFIKAREAYQKQ